MKTRIRIQAGTVVFDRTGGHLKVFQEDVVVEDATLEGDEYVFNLGWTHRTYSVHAATVHVLPAAKAAGDDASYC
jgi:hypothetical protein